MSDQEWLVRLQFLEEAQEYLDTIESALLGLGEQKLPREALDGILRAAHSIKGGAALMGFTELSQVAHRLEDFFKVLQGGRYEPEGELERLFLSVVDKMRQMLERCRDRSGIDETWLQENTQPLLDQLYDRLGNPTAADEQAGLTADAGGDMGIMLFESEIGPCLDRLEGALHSPNLPLLRQEFLIACEEMGSLGEMLDLGQFAALCHHSLQLCTDCHDEHLAEICQTVLKPLRRSHGLVLVDQAGLIPEVVSLSPALQAIMDSATDATQLSHDAATTVKIESQAEEPDAVEQDDSVPAYVSEEAPPSLLTEASDFIELADCLDTAEASDNSVALGGIFSLNLQKALTEEESLSEAETLAATHSTEQPASTPLETDALDTDALDNEQPLDLPTLEDCITQKSEQPEPASRPGNSGVETIDIADEAVLDSLFDGMSPEDFSLEEMALEAPAIGESTVPETDVAIAEHTPAESLALPSESLLTATAESKSSQSRELLDQSSSRIEPAIPLDLAEDVAEPISPAKTLATPEPTSLEAEALISDFLKDEAFDLEELASLNEPTSRSAFSIDAEPTPESVKSNNTQAEIAFQAEQLTSEMLRAPEPETSPNKDTSIRVSVRKLERLGELLGELTTERNGLNLQLGYLRNLFGLLNERVKSLDSANNILRQSYDRGATQLLHSKTTIAAENNISDSEISSGIHATQSTTNGFDLLEMDQYSELHLVSQKIIESVVQIQEVNSDIELALGETETVSRGLNRTAQQLQVGMNQMRMRPLSAITDRFPRLLRELSMAHNKQVDLQVRGGGTLIERTIIEALQDPLMHLLRNCFDHGIEDPETRIAQGKPPQGNIEIGASYRGNQVALTIQDDGAGINLDRIRSKVLTMGLSPAEIEASGDQELVNLIFEPGFSTAEKVTDLSGRGVGMDVVRSNLRDIQGDISVETSAGEGSTFTLTVPLSLSVTRVLVVECQGMLMAFPANIVEEMLLLEQQNIVQAAEQNLLEWQGYTVPLLRLQDWLHFVRPLIKLETESSPIIDQSSALIVTHGEEPYAIECDRYWGEQEVTTRTVEGNISLPQGFSGCVVLGDGRVVPLVEMEKLMSWVLRDAQRQDVHQQNLALPVALSNKRTVLVIDDSINVRRFLSITLEKAGYHVEQAKDGQDAIEKLQDGITADVIMSDVEMPRLDGFGFLAQVKSIENCENIPVVMLTSRSGDKHRQLAMSLGAADYFSKPFKQNELLQTLEQLIDLSTPSVRSTALPELVNV